ncbi:MAG: prenyltransferase, partial [Candidatus Binatia bacterium]
MTEVASELPIGIAEAARNWREVLLTGNLSADRRVDVVSRWLLMTRAAVFPMTLVSGAIGGLLALGHPEANAGLFALALLGLLAAHAANNLMNDYFDLAGGVDTENYPRALYAPHPVLSGMVSRTGLAVRA